MINLHRLRHNLFFDLIGLSLLILLAPCISQAQESIETEELKQHYIVELIVFNHLHPGDEEVWPDTVAELDAGALDLTHTESGNEAVLPLPYTLLGDEWLSMKDIWTRMMRSAPYHPILHIAWYQPGLDKKQAQNIYFYEGMQQLIPPLDTEEIITPEIEEGRGMDEDGSSIMEDQSLVDDDPITIKGTARLLVSRYLHLDLDIIFSSELPPSSIEEEKELMSFDSAFYNIFGNKSDVMEQEVPGIWHYKMRQQRKMRLDEIHYFDHPRFGVLARVSRFNVDTMRDKAPQGIEHE